MSDRNLLMSTFSVFLLSYVADSSLWIDRGDKEEVEEESYSSFYHLTAPAKMYVNCIEREY